MNGQPKTIFALSSGRPPAGIAVVRISGPDAAAVLTLLAGKLPRPRMASLVELRDPDSAELLDRGLALWMPGPGTATGDDVAELHLHGGRAVVDTVLGALSRRPGLRPAQPGEFTRRAFENGRLDLNEAEGLADLLAAETDSQRRAALLSSSGAMSRLIEDWQRRLLAISAALEADLDHSDEDDVSATDMRQLFADATALAEDIRALLARPAAERLRDGLRVVLAGPPNSGKSSLLNALAGRAAAIESPTPGTTRDAIEVPVALEGMPLVLIDTAGLREAEDVIESIGVRRAEDAIRLADILLWLGDDDPPAALNAIALYPRADTRSPHTNRLRVSAKTGEGLAELSAAIVDLGKRMLPHEGEVALTRRHREAARELLVHLEAMMSTGDPLIAADHVRQALLVCDHLTGRAGVEEMLDTLFARFCVGK